MPNYALEDVAPPRIDLAVNMVSFQEMTTDQVEGYVRHASERGAPVHAACLRRKANGASSAISAALPPLPQPLPQPSSSVEDPVGSLPISHSSTLT